MVTFRLIAGWTLSVGGWGLWHAWHVWLRASRHAAICMGRVAREDLLFWFAIWQWIKPVCSVQELGWQAKRCSCTCTYGSEGLVALLAKISWRNSKIQKVTKKSHDLRHRILGLSACMCEEPLFWQARGSLVFSKHFKTFGCMAGQAWKTSNPF